MTYDLTKGSERRAMLTFALPMICGGLLQQLYNIADAYVVGRYLGPVALAAVGSSYTFMTLVTSFIIGLCMGGGVVLSQLYGAGEHRNFRTAVFNSAVLTLALTAILNAAAYLLLDRAIKWLNVPSDAVLDMRTYLGTVLGGLVFVFIYNSLAALLRSVGNSSAPLVFLACSAVLNVGLDFLFVAGLGREVRGAAEATVISQMAAALGLAIYSAVKCRALFPRKENLRVERAMLRRVASSSVLTCVQQSVMNFGILMIQGLVNSFGVSAMAAFTVAVKIDTFAYLPAQEFGGAFGTFIAQNDGAGKPDRVRRGIAEAIKLSALMCIPVSIIVNIFARGLVTVFVGAENADVIDIGVRYLRIEGSFYIGIGVLFLMYALYRGLEKPLMSVVLTVVSLGTRVLLAYTLSPQLGLGIIWAAIPIGWFLADAVGLIVYGHIRKKRQAT